MSTVLYITVIELENLYNALDCHRVKRRNGDKACNYKHTVKMPVVLLTQEFLLCSQLMFPH